MRAFTLIEFIITLAIVALLCSVGATWVWHTDTDLLTQELSALQQSILLLQYKAVSTNSIQKIFINRTKKLFWYQHNDKKYKHFLHKQTDFGFLPNAKGPPSNPTTPIKKAITFDLDVENDGICLYPDGTADAGTLYIITANMHKMAALTCGVSQVFYVGRYFYSNGSWVCADTQ